MWQRLKELWRPTGVINRSFRLPAGLRIYAIGDVHGCLDLLDQLLTKISADAGSRPIDQTMLIFLGDLIDRGPHSAGVVELLRRVAEGYSCSRFLLGNHEEVFLRCLDGDARALHAFCRMGGRETALSYGIGTDDFERMDDQELLTALVDAVPRSHRDFIETFEEIVVIGDFAFVHAGIDPRRPIAEQDPLDLRWIRSPFLSSRRALEKTVVHGHSISDDVDFGISRVGIDTGAFKTGKLTAICLEDDKYWILQT